MAVTVPVVQVWVVRMLVPHRSVVMPMAVGLAGRITGAVGVLVMLVVNVAVFVI